MASAVVATPRPASTVALLRDARGGGIDVWLMRRVPTMAFAPGVYVFPGGAVEDADGDPSIGWTGTSPHAFASAFGVDDAAARALVSAAVRETFEECGVLLAASDDEALDTADPMWERRRVDLVGSSASWPELLGALDRPLRGDRLVPWARWITPDWSPRRFDARFFLARVPGGQQPRWIDGEADRAGWWSVRAAVGAHDDDELAMLPPTITTLRQLAEHDDVASALEAAPVVVEAAG